MKTVSTEENGKCARQIQKKATGKTPGSCKNRESRKESER